MRLLVVLVILVLGVATSPASGRLQPDQVLLLVNSNMGEGALLASHYAATRGIPKDNVLVLKLPVREDLSFEMYEEDVYNAIRQHLLKTGKADKIRCIVPMYGVPLRIRGRERTPEIEAEYESIRAKLKETLARIEQIVSNLERRAAESAPGFRPGTEATSNGLAQRAQAAFLAIDSKIRITPPGPERAKAVRELAELFKELGGLNGYTSLLQARDDWSPTVDDRQRIKEIVAANKEGAAGMEAYVWRRWDPVARQKVRDGLARYIGLFGLAEVLAGMEGYLAPGDTTASLDAELSFLWLNWYRRERWIINPLNHRFYDVNVSSKLLMVMRLDGPTPQVVRDIIANSVLVEREGLKGRVVLDARGIAFAEKDGYSHFDEKLRNAAALLKKNTTLDVHLDNKSDLIPANSQDDVAIYCGWYSHATYVPSCRFVRGAVGYHVASSELVTMRGETKVWVPNLLRAGVVMSLGPVAEPFLHAFPDPGEFIPLMLTGELTMAEVYWLTQPTGSWMMAAVGDPLYRPFAKNPRYKVQDLPESLRRGIQRMNPATRPTP